MPDPETTVVRWDALTYDGSAPGRNTPSLHIYLRPVSREGDIPHAARRLFQDLISHFYSGPPFLTPAEKLRDTVGHALEHGNRASGRDSLDQLHMGVAILDRASGELHIYRSGDVRLHVAGRPTESGSPGGFERINLGLASHATIVDGSAPQDAFPGSPGAGERLIVDGRTLGLGIRIGDDTETTGHVTPTTPDLADVAIAEAVLDSPARNSPSEVTPLIDPEEAHDPPPHLDLPDGERSPGLPLLPVAVVALIFMIAVFWRDPADQNRPAEVDNAPILAGTAPATTATLPDGAPVRNPGPHPEAGSIAWTFHADAAVTSSPLLLGNEVFVGSRDGHLYALNRYNGSVMWKVAGPGGVGSSPTTGAGKIYFGEYGGALVAVDAASGTESWRFSTGGKIVSSPHYADGVVYVGSFDKHLYALNAETGDELWHYLTGDAIWSSPRSTSDLVFIGSLDRSLYAVRRSDGKLVWRQRTGGPFYSSPAISGDELFIGSRDGTLYKLSASTGEILWKTKVSESIHSTAAVTDDRVIIGAEEGTIICVSRATGEPFWSFPTGARVPSSPALGPNTVFAGSYDQYLYALDLESGHPLWRTDLAGSIYSSPRIGSDRLFVGTNQGRLVALNLGSTGAP